MLVYANTLHIPRDTGSQPRILAAIDAWLQAKTPALNATACVNKPSVRLADGKELEVVVSGGAPDGADTLGSVVFSHPDQTVRGRKWFVRIGFRVPHAESPSTVTLVLETSDISVHAGSARAFATRPGVVTRLVQACGLVAPSPDAAVHELTPETADAFAADIRRPERQYAVVLISREPFSERYYADPTDMLGQVLGLARVVVIPNKAHGKPIGDIVGRRYVAWGGAINVIMPPLRAGSVPTQLISADQLHYETGRDKSPASYLLYLLTHRLNLPHYRQEITPAAVRQHALDIRVATLKGAAQTAEQLQMMVQLLEEQIREKDQQFQQLSVQNEKLWAEYQDADQRASEVPGLRSQILAFRQAFDRIKKEGHLPSEAPPAVTSVAQAIDLARNMFPDQLAFSFNSKSEDDDSPYEEPEEVFAALRWLATTYYDSKTGRQECPDLEESLAGEVSGWHYVAHQKDSTMKDRKEWYQCAWPDAPGGRLWIPEHLKGGAGRSRRPEETIRIAFTWERSAKKVVVGYIGQHQENTRS